MKPEPRPNRQDLEYRFAEKMYGDEFHALGDYISPTGRKFRAAAWMLSHVVARLGGRQPGVAMEKLQAMVLGDIRAQVHEHNRLTQPIDNEPPIVCWSSAPAWASPKGCDCPLCTAWKSTLEDGVPPNWPAIEALRARGVILR